MDCSNYPLKGRKVQTLGVSINVLRFCRIVMNFIIIFENVLVVSPALALCFPASYVTYIIALTIKYVMVSTESSVEDVPCIPPVSTQITCLVGGLQLFSVLHEQCLCSPS